MNITKFNRLGWVLAGALFGILGAGGFQTPADKVGVVDLAKLADESNFGKAAVVELEELKDSRQQILEFIEQNRVLTNEQALRLRELGLKVGRSAEETAEFERIKADVRASAKRAEDLVAKANRSQDENAVLQDYQTRANTMEQVTQRWFREFMQELQEAEARNRAGVLDRARQSVQEVAKAQGFSVVFSTSSAPYGANDLTAAALQAMNAKK